jgi:hypothetical protein
LALLAMALVLPALGAGLFQDDVVHWAKLVDGRVLPDQYYGTPLFPDDSGAARSAMRDMFAVTRAPEDVATLIDQGLFPWWTYPQLRASNWRPVTALTHWLDYRLFPHRPALMHAENIFLFGGVVFMAALLYRRVMGGVWVAALAALLYAIDESNYYPVRWVANRNLLMALCFALATLLCHDRWRQDRNRLCGGLAPVLLLVSLLCTEAGTATFAYLAAYALVLDRGRLPTRVLTLLPAIVVIVGWRLIYNRLGHGAAGGGFIIDPGREPVAYVQAVLQRAPFLLAGQWSPLWADTYWVFSERAVRAYLVPVGAFVLLVFIVVVPLLRKDRAARFWFIGMLMCILPICASVPMNRNLLFAAVGAFGLMACYLGGALGQADWMPQRRLWRVPIRMMGAVLLLVHVPGALAGRLWSHKMFGRTERVIYSTVDIGEAPDLSDKRVVVVNAPNPFLFIGAPAVWSYENKAVPQVARVLVPGWRELKLTRTGQHTLVVQAARGNLLSVDETNRQMAPNFVYMWRTFNDLFRGKKEPFEVGQEVVMPELSATILALDAAGFPAQVRFDFATSLDDPSLHWLQWRWARRGLGAYARFEVPAIGQSTTLPGAL